jgi:hypothetical protein
MQPVGNETFDIGRDTGAPVPDDRTPEGKFEGSIERVTVMLSGAAVRDEKVQREPD